MFQEILCQAQSIALKKWQGKQNFSQNPKLTSLAVLMLQSEKG